MSDQDLKQRISDIVEENRDAIVAGLSEILKFRTVSGSSDKETEASFRAETEKCLKFLEGQAATMGLDWRNYDNILAILELKAGEHFIGLPVHVDVVPPGEGWTHGPFDGVVAGGTIWGRGCQDDKGPVIETLWAVNVLKLLGRELKRGARLIIGTEEEGGDWADVRSYASREPECDFCIVSDAAFPIINGEKGMLNLGMRAILGEDESPNVGGFRVASATAGERANIVPPRAELVFEGDADSDPAQLERELNRFLTKESAAHAEITHTMKGAVKKVTLTFQGKGAHGSTPQEGHNAALDLLLFMTQSGFVSDDEADLAQFLHESGSDFQGGRLGIGVKHDFIGPTSVNLGILRWNSGEASVVFNIRNTMGLTSAETVKRATEAINEFAEETGFDVHAEPQGKTMEPVYVDPADHPEFIGALQEAYTTTTGREATLHAIGGTTYAKVFPRAVCFGPVEPAEEEELAHQTDERVKVDHLLRNVKIYAYALAKLCAA